MAVTGSLARTRDHPRIRGEHPIAAKPDNLVMGSSPHTRGAHRRRPARSAATRIIPAYAGSTVRRRQPPRSPWDHPRIRGEHPGLGRRPSWRGGSSPHTRGAPLGDRHLRCVHGIIPAYAGSTRRSAAPRNRSPDHPRIRGEHPVVRIAEGALVGSSPHTRGALNGANIGYKARRIIPAYAGSTHQGVRRGREGGDHPRIRGEHCQRSRLAPPIWGSSPHTRGAQF